MKASVGAVVQYKDKEGAQAAIIVKVVTDDCVCLCIWNCDGIQYVKTNVVKGDSQGQWNYPVVGT